MAKECEEAVRQVEDRSRQRTQTICEDDLTCMCGESEETIQHILCECESLARERALHAASPVTIMDMTLEPEMCRKILQSRFPGLRISNTPNTHNAEVHEVVGGTELPHGILGVAFA